jgi:hypothetical protein
MTFDEYLNKPDPMAGFCLADSWSPDEQAAARQAWDAREPETQQAIDMMQSARTELDLLRQALRVAVEPHQSLFERMMEAAQTAAQLDADDSECCGKPVVGAEYMGQQEMVCCGNPEPKGEPAPTSGPLVDDLRAMVIRLARALRKAAPDNDLPKQATDYLTRKGIGMNPLRAPVAPKAETVAVQEALDKVRDIWLDWCDNHIQASAAKAAFDRVFRAPLPVAPKAEPADEARDWARVQLFAKKIMALMDTKECALSSVSGLAHDASERADWIERIARKYLATPQADSAVAPKAEPAEDAVQAAFEAWLTRTGPSGDVTEVQRQWEASSDYADLFTTPQADSAQPVADRSAEAQALTLRSLLEDWLTSFADTIEGGEADELVSATRAALSQGTRQAEPVALTDEQIIAAARTAKAAHWNLTDAGCVLIGRAVLAAASAPAPELTPYQRDRMTISLRPQSFGEWPDPAPVAAAEAEDMSPRVELVKKALFDIARREGLALTWTDRLRIGQAVGMLDNTNQNP